MDYTRPDALVSTDWLAAHLGDPGVAVIDASFHLPDAGRDAKAEFAEAHIPGARSFDIDDVCDPNSPLPHMVPSAELFAAKVGALGIGSGQRIICYDVYGGASAAARVWWMFRLFGHDNVALLNGGLRSWRAEGRDMEAGEPPAPAAKTFKAELRPALLRTIDQVHANLDSGAEQVADARSPGRFDASEPEIRPGMRGGHIPGSRNLFFADMIDRENHGAMKPADGLAEVIEKSGVNPQKPVITSCGSGVTACVPALAFYLLGYPDAAVYDGSWTEWGGRDDTPVDTGPAD